MTYKGAFTVLGTPERLESSYHSSTHEWPQMRREIIGLIERVDNSSYHTTVKGRRSDE